jgi:hypothetical protein
MGIKVDRKPLIAESYLQNMVGKSASAPPFASFKDRPFYKGGRTKGKKR